ncbi:DUF4376 domain-containing protein [Escherichia coli]|nr:DUF4376 domain-containing protein [Escherichia coli]EHS3442287.1 DUF4376 domain-containing protein [Escherichia coli]EHS3566138.1 DUF4376 domain-containing protein [Escherichia coli]EHS3570180.1 DUF4376 domain-containing protein [Escherichia coli]EHS3600813.1 DUF4376 domain-containing protein [Escherichia coli]
MKIRAVKGIRNAHYLENGAVDCEVLFEGETEFVLYTAIQDDMAPTGQHVWQELQSGKWGEIAPFTVTPELIAAAKDAKRREIEAWRDSQENVEFIFTFDDRRFDGGKTSQSRLAPVVAAAQAGLLPEGFFWTDADNNNVVLTREKLIALNDAMMVAMVAEGFKIHERQREMKEQLNNLDDLRSIREMAISGNHAR